MKKKEKLTRRDIEELMGVNKKGWKRKNGALTQKVRGLDRMKQICDQVEFYTVILIHYNPSRHVLLNKGKRERPILQGVSQNGLADPGILGINSGAGLAVVLFIYFFQGSMTGLCAFGIYYPAVRICRRFGYALFGKKNGRGKA